jgi:hypothetical protein
MGSALLCGRMVREYRISPGRPNQFPVSPFAAGAFAADEMITTITATPLSCISRPRSLIEPKEHRQESRLGRRERSQAEMVSCQFVLEFVNAALDGRPPVVIAPDIQRRVAAIGDKNPKDVTGQINELAANGRRLIGLEFFAYHHEASLGSGTLLHDTWEELK